MSRSTIEFAKVTVVQCILQAVNGLESLAQEKHTLEELERNLAVLDADLTDARGCCGKKLVNVN